MNNRENIQTPDKIKDGQNGKNIDRKKNVRTKTKQTNDRTKYF